MLRIHNRVSQENNEANRSYVVGIFLLLIFSAFFTESIGVHAFFGSFVAGIIVPKTGKFVRVLAPKIELIIVDFFLPLYFVSSGLKTSLQSINTPYLGGCLVAIICIACVAKFVPAFLVAKLVTKRDWSYCASVGVLMNTRGLVELIALNVGLQDGILTTPMFSMLVVMALVTTFASPVLLHFLYVRHMPNKPHLPQDADVGDAKSDGGALDENLQLTVMSTAVPASVADPDCDAQSAVGRNPVSMSDDVAVSGDVDEQHVARVANLVSPVAESY